MAHVTPTPLAAFAPIVLVAVIVVSGIFYLRRKGYSQPSGNDVVVRCRAGHLFTTIWIPGISLKAVRLGSIRFQYCPIGHHWALVDVVNEWELTEEERRFAHNHHDSRIP